MGCAAGQVGDASRMSLKERRLEIGRVAESGQRLVQVAPRPGTADAAAARCPRRRPRRRPGLDSRSSSAGASRKIAAIDGSRARPDQRATGRRGHRGAADRVEHDRREADRGEPRRLRHLLARQARPATLAVEAFERAQHGVTTASGSRSRCVRSAPTSQSARADSSTILGTRGARASTRSLSAPWPSPARNRSASIGPSRVDQIPARADGDVIATERGGRFVRGRRATREAHQTGVEHLALRRRCRALLGVPVRSPTGTRASLHPADARESGHW